MESKKKWYQWTDKIERDRLREQAYGCQREGIIRGFGMDMYTLLYLKWITNKDLCIADGTLLNAVWQSGWEGFWENGYMCMCVWVLCYSSETITTLLIGYTPIPKNFLIQLIIMWHDGGNILLFFIVFILLLTLWSLPKSTFEITMDHKIQVPRIIDLLQLLCSPQDI